MTGLRARGGHTVSLAWRGGKLDSARIDSDREGRVRLRLGRGAKAIDRTARAGSPLNLKAADFA